MDLDRDVNIEVPGQVEAGSLDRGAGTAPRFSSSAKGLALLADMLDDLAIPAAFFCEGRTLEETRDSSGCLAHFEIGVHGYDHESLGHMTRPDAIEAVRHGCQAVRDVIGRNPVAFRAPYMRQPRAVGDFLKEVGCGIHIDSSQYAYGDDCRPSLLPGYVAEIPVTEGTDAEGRRISAYLWPMHEGKRSPQDYIDLASAVPEDGVLVIADHTWHIVESRSGGVFSEDDLRENLEKTERVLRGILEAGNRPATLSEISRLAV
ncbi:polysaccharide deacetylase family protein [Methanomethylophilus alvi]|uniref:polysaccharide deacetylase family protein n=1 Tax=Methanomethylophilus alvi TaxID=1291540 RepID=UPI0037DC9B04